MIVRPADEGDLTRCQEIWVAADPPPSGGPVSGKEAPLLRDNPLHAHELATGRLLVAEDAGRVVGFGASLERSGRWLLADLFVDPRHAGAGTGRALLGALAAGAPARRVTLASEDRRALSLYARTGMAPRWPAYHLVGGLPARVAPPWLRAEPADVRDPDLLAWDERLSGVGRAEDLAWWAGPAGAVPLWLVDELGGRQGYAFVQPSNHAVLDAALRDAATVVTVRVARPELAVDGVLAALGWAAAKRRPLARLLVPGPHPAFAPLLEAGFRVAGMEMYCASHDDLFDPGRDVPSLTLL